MAASAAAALRELRPIAKVVQGQKMKEGAGVMITRTVGTGALRNLDPYLMLDELKLPAKAAFAGFPDHPHRGFETCSIVLEGQIEHRDSQGNQGVIGPGGVQWMTAGRGIVHSEMPKSTDGMLHGFQLWINLPKKDKMCKPRYQDYQKADIPIVPLDGSGGSSVRVMAGTSTHGGVAGPIKMRNPGLLMDVRLAAGDNFTQEVPEGWNGFCYVYDGEGKISGNRAQPEQTLVLGPGDHLVAAGGGGAAGLKFLLVAGKPIGEPIVQHGPFVMNTEEEIYQAMKDYQNGKLMSRSKVSHIKGRSSSTTTAGSSSSSRPAAVAGAGAGAAEASDSEEEGRAGPSSRAKARAGTDDTGSDADTAGPSPSRPAPASGFPRLPDGAAAAAAGQPVGGRAVAGAAAVATGGGSSSSSRAERRALRKQKKERAAATVVAAAGSGSEEGAAAGGVAADLARLKLSISGGRQGKDGEDQGGEDGDGSDEDWGLGRTKQKVKGGRRDRRREQPSTAHSGAVALQQQRQRSAGAAPAESGDEDR